MISWILIEQKYLVQNLPLALNNNDESEQATQVMVCVEWGGGVNDTHCSGSGSGRIFFGG